MYIFVDGDHTFSPEHKVHEVHARLNQHFDFIRSSRFSCSTCKAKLRLKKNADTTHILLSFRFGFKTEEQNIEKRDTEEKVEQ